MGDTEFSTERLLEQASGNQSAMFLMGVRWARERDGSVDAWANFVGSQSQTAGRASVMAVL
jgi:hypothetical protein